MGHRRPLTGHAPPPRSVCQQVRLAHAHPREQLAAGLAELEQETAGLRGAGEALRVLQIDGDLAWQCYAAALLADDLSGDEPESGSGT